MSPVTADKRKGKKQVRMKAHTTLNSDGEQHSEQSDIEGDKPPTPMTLRAL
jgi:hypothetical protein